MNCEMQFSQLQQCTT